MYLTFDETDTELIARMQERFLEQFTGLFGSLDIKQIEWRDIGFGHQPVVKIEAMPVLVGLSWPNNALTATVIAKKRTGEIRATAVLPEGFVDGSKWWQTRMIFPSSLGAQSRNVLAVLEAAKTICDQCDRCHGRGKSEGSDDYGRPSGEWSACWRCHGRGWLSDKDLWLKEDE